MTAFDFKRMVLGLPQGETFGEGLDVAAALAEALGLELLGASIEDAGVRQLAGLPSARELRGLGSGWQPVDTKRLLAELERTTKATRQRFFERVRARKIDKRFHLTRGTAADMVASLVRPTDIIALLEPKHPADRITQQTTDLAEAAFEAASTVLLLPCQIARKRGPIVAIAADPGDRSVRTATAIAAAAKEPLIILNASGSSIARSEGIPEEIHIEERPIRQLPASIPALAAMVSHLSEQLLVTPRVLLSPHGLQRMVSLRRIPALITTPGPARAP